ncbi:MAG: GxxExxY protein [Parcubacteria group bacterium]
MELLYKDETEIIINVLFTVYNEMGWGMREKQYENAIVQESRSKKLKVSNQKYVPVNYKKVKIGYNRIDLLFNDKILVELKVGEKLFKKDFDQINDYLRTMNLKLGLLVLYSPKGVSFRRIVNLK